MKYPEAKAALCTTQESGNYQPSLETMVSTFSLYDAECHAVATYRAGPPELGDGCALTLKIDNFGDDKVIVIRDMDLGAEGGADAEGFNDEAAFMFGFNGRSYGSRDDWCTGCSGQGSEDLDQGCSCGFCVGG